MLHTYFVRQIFESMKQVTRSWDISKSAGKDEFLRKQMRHQRTIEETRQATLVDVAEAVGLQKYVILDDAERLWNEWFEAYLAVKEDEANPITLADMLD